MLNRRGFLGALFAAVAAPVIAKALPPALPQLHPAAFSFATPPLDMAELHARYITPAMRSLADSIDEQAVIFAYRHKPPKMRVRFNPARLPA